EPLDIEYPDADSPGVLIKLGQFVSSRVDLLPSAVTDVLAELHDAVPPAPTSAVIAQIEADFGKPIGAVFPLFDQVALGAASLAQAHRARLVDGRAVVVKVLRPGIDLVVESDLVVASRYLGKLRRLRIFRHRVDLDVLTNEFVSVTRRELDLEAEAQNCIRFAADFADDPEIGTPALYLQWSGRRTLTMEDVSWFPIQDVGAYEAVGIDRRRVASRLMDCYLEQLYIKNFVHADPHPGNLFVRPLPVHDESDDRWTPELIGSRRLPLPRVENRPFQLVFIDFGMAVPIPEQYRRSFRTYAVGMGTRDAYTIVQSYIEGDILLPGTDIEELERLIAALLNRFPGAFVGQVREADLDQYGQLFGEYQNLMFNSPMKLKADLLFVFRAMGVCAGTVARIDPSFDPADRFTPMVQRLLADELAPTPERLNRLGSFVARLPSRLDAVLTQIERGKFTVRLDDPDRRREVKSLTRAANRVSAALLLAGALVCAVLLLRSGDASTANLALLGAGVVAAAVVIRAIR
ncbi:MAG: AarF/UbiB family protein, partial [Pseudomonadota bacterium]